MTTQSLSRIDHVVTYHSNYETTHLVFNNFLGAFWGVNFILLLNIFYHLLFEKKKKSFDA